MMKSTSKKTLLIIIIVYCAVLMHGQHFTVKEFNRNKAKTKTTADSLYLIETGYTTTGIVLKLAKDENLIGSYIIVNRDTLYFTEGEENATDNKQKFSNLLTFSSPVESFCFFPGLIKGNIEFYYINAQNETKEVTSRPSKKKKMQVVPNQT